MSKSFEVVDIDTNWSSLDHTVPCSDDSVDVAPSRDPATINERIAVIGLGYVSLPVAIAFADRCDHVVVFDVSADRIEALQADHDWTREIIGPKLLSSSVKFRRDAADLKQTSFFIVTVSTSVDCEHRPDQSQLRSACRSIGPHLTAGAIVKPLL